MKEPSIVPYLRKIKEEEDKKDKRIHISKEPPPYEYKENKKEEKKEYDPSVDFTIYKIKI